MSKEKAIKIKVSLLQMGISQAQIARDLELDRSSVNQVINGTRRSQRVENYLNEILSKAQSVKNDVRNYEGNIGQDNGQENE